MLAISTSDSKTAWQEVGNSRVSAFERTTGSLEQEPLRDDHNKPLISPPFVLYCISLRALTQPKGRARNLKKISETVSLVNLGKGTRN